MRVGGASGWPSESSWRDCVSASACDRHLGDSWMAKDLLEAETQNHRLINNNLGLLYQ